RISRGIPPIFENGLDKLLKKHVGTRFRVTTDLAAAVNGSELTFIAVGTPFDGTEIDLRQVISASREIGKILGSKKDYHVVTVKSTVVPGTTDDVVGPALEESSGKRRGRDFGLCMNPEFLREGEAIADFLQPDRIVIGGIDERARGLLARAYEAFPQ